MIEKVVVELYRLKCEHLCGHKWTSQSIPSRCPKCGSRTWNSGDRRFGAKLTLDGKTQTPNQWAKELGLNPITIRARMRKGLTDAECLHTERLKRNVHGNNNQRKTL